MSQVVEITIDLTNINCKPQIETFEITKTGERNIYCKSGEVGRRFFIPNMDTVVYRGFLKYAYRYRTEETDYREIIESMETAGAINEISKRLTSDLKRFKDRLTSAIKYYQILLE